MMDKKYFEDLLNKQKEKRHGDGGMEIANIFIGGAVTAIGAIATANGKNPIVRAIGSMGVILGTMNTASGGFYLGRSALLEDLIKTAPDSKEPEVTEG